MENNSKKKIVTLDLMKIIYLLGLFFYLHLSFFDFQQLNALNIFLKLKTFAFYFS